jgi:hypothetical protein
VILLEAQNVNPLERDEACPAQSDTSFQAVITSGTSLIGAIRKNFF